MFVRRFIALEESPQLYAALLTHRDGPDPWAVVAAAAGGMAAIFARAQVGQHISWHHVGERRLKCNVYRSIPS